MALRYKLLSKEIVRIPMHWEAQTGCDYCSSVSKSPFPKPVMLAKSRVPQHFNVKKYQFLSHKGQ